MVFHSIVPCVAILLSVCLMAACLNLDLKDLPDCPDVFIRPPFFISRKVAKSQRRNVYVKTLCVSASFCESYKELTLKQTSNL